MIHICRHKLPDIVYLFLSSEMVDNHNSDDRYVKSIRLLEENLRKKGIEHEFDIRLIMDDKLVDVQLFDEIYRRFKEELDKIAKENEEAEIILNVSSGTPAMKSVLQIIASLSDRYIAYQVDSPNKGSNHKVKDFKLEESWEKNKDANEETPPRVRESPYMSFLSEIERRIILKHVEVYDYEAAWLVFNNSEQKNDNDLNHLLLAAKKRIHLDRDGAEKKLKKVVDLDISHILPKKDDKGELIEYLMWLQIKQERKDYSDFIKGITPAFSNLCRRILVDNGVKINDNFKFDEDFLDSKLRPGKTVRQIIQFDPQKGDSQFITSGMLVKLINNCKNNCKLKKEIQKLVNEIRDVESKVRNKCAHEIAEITDDTIKKDTKGKNASEIMKKLKELAFLVLKITEDDLKGYKKLNELIEKKLKLS